MLSFVIRRILYSIPVILLASFLLFVFVSLTTDPLAKVRQNRDPNAVTRLALKVGLQEEPCTTTQPGAVLHCKHRPLVKQYAHFMGNVFTGKLGSSGVTGRPITKELKSAFGITVQLIFWGVLVSALLAVSIGVYSAVRQYSTLDYAFTGLSFIGLSMPPFWFGLMAIQFLSFKLKQWTGSAQPWFFSVGLPSFSDGPAIYFRHLALPVLTLAVQIIAAWSRYQRSSMLDVMNSDYIRTARAKGLSRWKVVLKHGLRNALIPLVTVMAVDIGLLFGGLLITESIFGIPGMGRLFITSLQNGDTSILVPWLLVTAVFIVAFNLLADVLYGVLDPRIRLT